MSKFKSNSQKMPTKEELKNLMSNPKSHDRLIGMIDEMKDMAHKNLMSNSKSQDRFIDMLAELNNMAQAPKRGMKPVSDWLKITVKPNSVNK